MARSNEKSRFVLAIVNECEQSVGYFALISYTVGELDNVLHKPLEVDRS